MNLAEIGIQYTFKYQNTDDKRFIKKNQTDLINKYTKINIYRNEF